MEREREREASKLAEGPLPQFFYFIIIPIVYAEFKLDIPAEGFLV